MRDRRLALRYARALLSAQPDPTQAESTGRFLSTLAEAMDQSEELRRHLLDPAVSRARRADALRALASAASMPAVVTNFLATLVENNRTAALPAIAEVYQELREASAGIVPAEITTAEPLSPELQTRAREAIRRRTGLEVDLTCTVEPALLGGAVTRIGSTVYDGSLRNQLEQLRRQLTQE
jgi:F-type H+-transporting ATPase subunit delta